MKKSDSSDLAKIRAEFSETVRKAAELKSPLLVRALATVPREHFVGPGPWKILRRPDLAGGYQITPDDDPRHLYDTVLVALDADQNINNGEPASLMRWLDQLDLQPGKRFLHIGCGVGYYTAIAAEVIGKTGQVVGVEIDPSLAARAVQNLASFQNVQVKTEDGSKFEESAFDAIFVNAGATEMQQTWLIQLGNGGRLLVPLTVDLPGMNAGGGHLLLVVNRPEGYAARFVSPVGIYHCSGARTSQGNDLLREAYQRGGQDSVRSLRMDEHDSDAECWLHAPNFCLSRLEQGP